MRKSQSTNPLLPALQATVKGLAARFGDIPLERKEILKEFSTFIQSRIRSGEVTYLNFICTHNSRRSHISQLWAHAAAHYFGISEVQSFSGGIEATAFNARVARAMREAGFNILQPTGGGNPLYEVRFAEGASPVLAFSKRYDDPSNPSADFAAIMTCSHADENCPVIRGAIARFALAYDDPGEFDNTPGEEAGYTYCVRQIGTEMLYGFSMVVDGNDF